MSLADDLFINMCKDIIDNGYSTEGEKVRPKFGFCNFGIVCLEFCVRGKPVFPFRFTRNIFFKETDVSTPDTIFTINGRFQGNTDALAFCIADHID